MKPHICRSCLIDSIYLLPKLCPLEKEAIGWYDNCMLRYSSRSIFGAMETGPIFSMWAAYNVTEQALFTQKLETLLDSLKKNASSGGSLQKYATGDIHVLGLWTIYGLLQCTPDLSQLQCDMCLDSAFLVIPPCCSEGMRVFSPSCNVRYETLLFSEPSADLPPPLALGFTPTSTMSTEGMVDAYVSLSF